MLSGFVVQDGFQHPHPQLVRIHVYLFLANLLNSGVLKYCLGQDVHSSFAPLLP